MKNIRIVELFAGVGGFRLGLESASNNKTKYKVVWSSQWEPGTTKQYASEIYVKHFGNKGHSCEDIKEVVDNKFDEIPNHDLLVGGFPCQDYSVARTLKQSQGLEGKKGVLWWSIYNILNKKGDKTPKFLMLENVDRLLKSPVKRRGRDFAVMLSSLASLGYVVEWRVINAADYGFPQRRRRIFILGYKKGTSLNKRLSACKNKKEWIEETGLIANEFKVEKEDCKLNEIEVGLNPVKVSSNFSKNEPKKSPFENAGVMVDGKVWTIKVESSYKGKKSVLGDFLLEESEVDDEFFIDKKDLGKWKKQKNAKSEWRVSSTGHKYKYSEGNMVFPDSVDRPSRTIITGEGGKSASRFKHVIITKSGKYRRLTPLELERLNMFPDNHTEGVPDTKRSFIMGNALVIGVIKGLGKSLRNNS